MSMLLGLLLAPAVPQMLSENAWLVEVRPGARRHFRERATLRARPGKAYVVAGDKLVADRSVGAFTFVIFVSPSGKATRGWIETAALRRVAPPPPSPAGWTGDWKFEDASIAITPGKRPGHLHATGTATWGGHDPERVARGGVNVGDFESDLAPRGDRMTYSQNDDPNLCRVDMRLIGPYLLVEDNNRCGGMNVTFSGTYRR
ncbi:hypothetical protein [Sphingomonas sp. MS122]|uniref:hypothetical protein n=1 Tax=Sphingomonas sp. MS122 TaxID=3412683 RepID=UPI003C2D6A0C